MRSEKSTRVRMPTTPSCAWSTTIDHDSVGPPIHLSVYRSLPSTDANTPSMLSFGTATVTELLEVGRTTDAGEFQGAPSMGISPSTTTWALGPTPLVETRFAAEGNRWWLRNPGSSRNTNTSPD